MRVEGFASNEEPHDFARTFKDRINPAIAHKSLQWDRFFATSFQRRGSFVSAATADLNGVVHNFPGLFGAPHFAHGSFEPNIRMFVAIDFVGGQQGHRFDSKSIRGHAGNFVRDGSVFAYRSAPLNALGGPTAADF